MYERGAANNRNCRLQRRGKLNQGTSQDLQTLKMLSPAISKEQTPAASSAAGVKRHADTPQSEQPFKKVRHEFSNDAALELALDHIRVDPVDHSLYERNADLVLDNALEGETFGDIISSSIDKVLAIAEVKKAKLDDWKYAMLRRSLTLISAQRILEGLGASLDKTYHFTNRTKNLEIERDANGYKILFTVTPVMSLEDDDPVTGGEGVALKSTKSVEMPSQGNDAVGCNGVEKDGSENESSEDSSEGGTSESEDDSEDDESGDSAGSDG